MLRLGILVGVRVHGYDLQSSGMLRGQANFGEWSPLREKGAQEQRCKALAEAKRGSFSLMSPVAALTDRRVRQSRPHLPA